MPNSDDTRGQPTNEVHKDKPDVPIPIAICGMACRLPGGLTSPQDLWEFVLAKKDARGRVPESRYNISSYYSAISKPGTISTEYGCFLDESVDLGALDTSFFSLPRTEVERADPQQRLMLEVARECFEDAGLTNWRGKTIGCYIGNFGEDWIEMFAKEPQQWGMHRIVGTGDFVISNRLSYEFDIKGPSMTIRTGCSAALVSLNEACAAIARGDCEGALVGGVNIILGPSMTAAMTEQGILSKDGACKSFSAEANGYARGEAVTAIYVKPLADAIRDGNPVRAVIRATSHNVDGKTPGLSQPSTDAQEALIRRAYQLASITDFSETAMVECHGTGTPTGDPIEAKAVARVFGEKGVYIGSVKPNLAHTEGASGLVSLIKMVKALENRTIPPNIRFETPNPNIPFKEAKLVVPLEPMEWPQDRLERVSLNSFGVGGANAHVIMESAATYKASTVFHETPDFSQLLLYTANSANSLTRMIENYREWVGKNTDKVRDLAYTLAIKREHLPHRAFAIFKNGTLENVSAPAHMKSPKKPNLIMVFTGQGAQWPQMGRELMQSNPTFKATIQYLDRCLQDISGNKPSYSVEEELQKPAKKSRISLAELSQPLCTAVQIGLFDALKIAGVIPDAVVGHSSGEIAAAYASGALTAQEAIIAAHHRGAVTTMQKRPGSMAAIGMSWEDTEKYLIPNVTLACHNSPRSVTISGDTPAVQAVVAGLHESRPDVMARLLKVDKAYHSYHMAEIGENYISMISESVAGKEPSIPFFSSVTGDHLSEGQTVGAQYWRSNLESPVRFKEAITAIAKHEIGKTAVWLEVGPHSALAGPVRQTLTEVSSPAPYVAAMNRGQDCMTSFLTAIGKLYSLGVHLDLHALFPSGSCLADLPRYPWNHEESYWYEPRVCREWRHRKYPYHDLLGVKVPESTDLEPVWRNMFHISNAPWIRDHRIGEDCVFPFAGYIALAGEAVRQITGISDGFCVQNITVNLALVLSEGKPTEIMSSFRPHRLTNSTNSSYWEFTVASYNGHVWTKHCNGRVCVLTSDLGLGPEPGPLPRKINAKKWYENMQKGGLDLGQCFQTLETIETSANSENQAIGRVINGRQGDEANYHIHPTVLDATIQLLGAAAVNGHARMTKTWLPSSMEKFSVYRCFSDMTSIVTATISSNHSVVGSGSCVVDGMKVVEASGIRMSLADGVFSSEIPDTHAAARYEWNADIEFMDISRLLKSPRRSDYFDRLEELARLCLLSSKQNILERDIALPRRQQYMAWIKSQMPSTTGILDDKEIRRRINAMMTQLCNTPVAPAAMAISGVYNNMESILSGLNLDEVLSDGNFTQLYECLNWSDRNEFVKTLGHSIPNQRILEIGNGKVSSASEIIEALTRSDGYILCSKYTLTSPGYISGKDQHLVFPNMEYMSLDIGQDPFEQGFQDLQYDLIIVTNILHNRKSLKESLVNIKKLLRPNGRLLLQELSSRPIWIDFVFGTLTSWWSEADDGRMDTSFRSSERWQLELTDAGFHEIEGIVSDNFSTVIVAKNITTTKSHTKKVTVLCEEQGTIVKQILSGLEMDGYDVTICSLVDSPPAGQDILSLLDAEKPFFENMEDHRFHIFKDFLHRLKDVGVLWLTHLCEHGCNDPRYAQIIGLARVIRSEALAEFATCEVDDFSNHVSIAQVLKVLGRFRIREAEETMDPDNEWTIRNGEVNVGRFYPFPLRDELLISESDDAAVLDVATVGRINSLHWARRPRETLKSNEVEVQVHSAGLNFRDILVALGIVELPIRQFGLEASGIITRVGSDVDPDELKVGDRVFCLKKQAYSTYITTPTTFCIRIPDYLSFSDASSMLMPYVTAIHSLINVGRMEKGQTALVHSACGGVGLAAVQICQMLGVDLYVTVSNKEKVQFLTDNFRIPHNRIFQSRDSSFVDGILRETGGRGVDIVLNSLAGELLHATWSIVAEFGTLVEIGKRDLIGDAKLDMKPFLANRSYCCVDIDQLWKKPTLLRSLIIDTLKYYVEGYTTPIRPNKVFPASQTQDAFRYMQKGQHIGKITISISHDTHETEALETTKRVLPIAFKSSASYLLVGGLGGLGRAISTWMVDNGARELIYLSRSAGKIPNKDDMFVNELESMGCTVKLVQGDVTKPEDVERAIAEAGYPLAGVIQMSMVLRDQNFTKMTFDEWSAATRPKVQGTWNLHNATLSVAANLDFMVLFSSLSGIIGQPGQSNYASANTFLDAFAHYRNALGLAASVVDIGAVEDVGFIAENKGLMSKMKTSGFKGVTEQELLDAMTVAMLAHSQPPKAAGVAKSYFVHANTFVLGLGSSVPVNSPANRAVWKRDRRMAAYHNVSAGVDVQSNDTLKTTVASCKADHALLKSPEIAKIFALEIGKKLFDLLLKPQEDLNTSWALVDLGLDSLVALELRAWWKQVFGFDITVLVMMGMGSLDALGQHAAEEMLKFITEETAQNAS
ncbi:putative polyketide synthase [Pyrenochaeta sp. MPI-SDFR-AT-0127]|nr:putative polyketide synthase [Pyrenochaeta sp. MPI-SDFR-AT-0127]